MKHAYNIIKNGIRNPRFFMEALKIPWKYIVQTIVVVVTLLAIGNTIKMHTYIQDLRSHIMSASQYFPAFTIEDGNMELEDGEKPMYYHSPSVQIIIDDSINLKASNSEENIERISKLYPPHSQSLNIYLFKDQALITIYQQLQLISYTNGFFTNQNEFAYLLHVATSSFIVIYGSLFLASFLVVLLPYLFHLLILTLLAAIYNARLTQDLPFSLRFKLGTIVSVVPILLAQLLSLFLPIFPSIYLVSLVSSLILIFYMFKNHTRFIQHVMHYTNTTTLDEFKKVLEEKVHTNKNTNSKKEDSEEKPE